MAEPFEITVNGGTRTVAPGVTVAAALLAAGVTAFRRSVNGEARGPLCGMGTCFECRVTIDGVPHCRSCQTLCRPGMSVVTDAP
jgi:sarcosine oxidase subunit alpha